VDEAKSDPAKGGISRRRLLAGGMVATPTLALLHETIPHAGLHRALAGESHPGAHDAEGTSLGHVAGGHATFAEGRQVDHQANGFHPTELLRDFDYGTTRRLANGQVLREWHLVAIEKEIEVAPGISYPAWTYNGRVPGPTLRCREGERLAIHFSNGSAHPHTIHFHGLHPAVMDGMPGVGEGIGGGTIEAGESFTYEFVAEPFGLHLYHCHVSPLASHIARGLYGAFIVDPAQGRPEADEMVMVMNGFDTDFDGENEFYAVNTIPFHHVNEPVKVKRGELVRIFLVNILEHDPLNSFHVHANFFHYYPTGTSLQPIEFTDTIIQGQGQRGILELKFPYRGKFMFHAHVSEFAELGWTGFFEVE
jgi:FtsP/CotA-like multicopper oxidase with cupredoxin domain